MKSSLQESSLQPLSGLDALFLQLEAAEMPMHVGSLNLLALPKGHRGDFAPRIRALLRDRLHLAPAFTRGLVPMPLGIANPCWIEASDIDLDRHVRSLTLPAPGTMAQLEACVARLHAQPLDRSRPLWQLAVIHGLGGALKGHVGYYAKVHHAAIDGQAGVALAQALLDVTPEPRVVAPPPARRHPALPGALQRLRAAAAGSARKWRELAELLPQAAQVLAGAVADARRDGGTSAAGSAGVATGPAAVTRPAVKAAPSGVIGPRTPLSVIVTPRRAFTTASIPLADVKTVAKALIVSVNDVVLATCSGALRRWLHAHGGVPAKTLTAGVPFSIRGSGDERANNQVSMMLAGLATDIADPAQRLAAIHASMARGKAITGRLRTLVPTDYPSLGAAWLAAGIARAATAIGHRLAPGTHLPSPAQVAISNVPGPPVPLYLAGARLVHYWPLSIVVHGVALNITVQSYDGQVDFGLVACPQAVPDLKRFKRLLADAFEELRGLASTAAEPGAQRPAASVESVAATAPAARSPAPRRAPKAAPRPASAAVRRATARPARSPRRGPAAANRATTARGRR